SVVLSVVTSGPPPFRMALSGSSSVEVRCGPSYSSESVVRPAKLAFRFWSWRRRLPSEKIFVFAQYGDYPVDSAGVKADADGQGVGHAEG
ncbi:MAG: hypothetical protein ACREN6_18190, partial [Gemmatimonadaceae bacterium]